MKIGDAARELVEKLLPHLWYDDYEWSLVFNDKTIPAYHTFSTAGIHSGDTLFLYGKNRLPEWLPYMVSNRNFPRF